MSFEIEKTNYVPFYINNWDTIHSELSSKYHVPAHVVRETATTTYDWNYENFGTLHTELQKRFSALNIEVHRARFFYTKPRCSLGIHIDGTNKLGHYYWAINFPVHVPKDNHFQEWYSYDGNYIRNYNNAYTDSTLLESPDRVKLIDRLVLDKPYLVKVGIPHAVFNHTDSIRLILSIRFYTARENTLKLIKSSIAQEAFSNSVHKN